MKIPFRRATGLVLATAAAVTLASCVGDGDEVLGPIDPFNGGALFERYVSLGNSITAGFQSGGIVDTLQLRAYPVLLAQRAGTAFGVQTLAKPGCPAPFLSPLGPRPAGAPPCAGAVGQPNLRRVSNLAVPGARIADLFDINNNVGISPLYSILTGGRSQVDAMLAQDPTFVSVWIGNNDALAAALSGILGPLAPGGAPQLTPLSEFQASVGQLEAAIQEADPQGAMVIGVVNPTFVPLLQPGAYFFLSRDAAGEFQDKPVNNNCSPVTPLGTPNPLAANLISFQIVSSAVPEINCDPSQYGGAFVLDQNEIATLTQRVNDYNAALKAIADDNGWIWVNPNAMLSPYLLEQNAAGLFQRIRKCQLLASATTAAEFQAAVLRSCPVPPTGVTQPFAAPNFFGSLISFDGVHPSSEAHRILADRFAQLIDDEYGTNLVP